MTHLIEILPLALILTAILLINIRTKEYFGHKSRLRDLNNELLSYSKQTDNLSSLIFDIRKEQAESKKKLNNVTVKLGMGIND